MRTHLEPSTPSRPGRAHAPLVAIGVVLAVTGLVVGACTGNVPTRGQAQAETTTAVPNESSWLDALVSAVKEPAANGSVPHDPGRGLQEVSPSAQSSAEAAEQENAEAAGLRGIDVCAMHDPTAATTASKKDVADSLMPGDELSRCKLSLADKDNGIPTFDLSIDVSHFPNAARQSTTPVTIKGTQFFKSKPFPGEGADQPCRLTLPKGPNFGLSLMVFPPTEDDRPGRPAACELASAYLEATVSKWRNPPARTAQLTEPALAAAAVDPCASLTTAQAMLPGPTSTLLLEPFSCVVTSTSNRKDFVGLRLEIDDPLPTSGSIQSTGDIPVQVNGSPAVQHDTGIAILGCETRVPIDNKTSLQEDQSSEHNPQRIEMAVITASTCKQSLQAANSISPALPH